MQQFIAEESFWNLFPEASIGVLVIKDMKQEEDLTPAQRSNLSQLLAAANGMAEIHLPHSNIAENEVVKVWRDAYRKFKTKKGARSSIECLLKRVLNGKPVTAIIPLVDVYNIVSLKHALPVGGEDLDSIEGDLRLRLTEGNDDFKPLGSWEEDPTLPGELCYLDDEGAVCRCWNWRDGERTALYDDTKRAVLVIESVDPARKNDVETALDELSSLATHLLGAVVETRGIATRENPVVTIAE